MASNGYLRIGELARRTGVSPEVLRAWEQRYGLLRPERTPGGFRLYGDADERRVRRVKDLITAGVAAGEAARRVLEDGASPTPEPAGGALDDLRLDLRLALDTFDGERAHEAFDRLLAALAVESVLKDVVLPYLRELGERWERGEVSVAQEHFASNLLRGRLLGLARDWDAAPGPGVVLACPPGERHDLPLIAFGVVAGRRGWRVTFLGGDTPFDTLEDAVRSARASLVVLSVATPAALDAHADAVRHLASIAPVAIGGHADPERIRSLGASPLEGDPVDAARTLSTRR
jgi:DNA-binding transcriptional MerR regulator